MVSGLPSQSLTGSNIGKLSYWLLVTGCWLLVANPPVEALDKIYGRTIDISVRPVCGVTATILISSHYHLATSNQ